MMNQLTENWRQEKKFSDLLEAIAQSLKRIEQYLNPNFQRLRQQQEARSERDRLKDEEAREKRRISAETRQILTTRLTADLKPSGEKERDAVNRAASGLLKRIKRTVVTSFQVHAKTCNIIEEVKSVPLGPKSRQRIDEMIARS